MVLDWITYTNLKPEILLYVVLTHVGQILSLMPSWTGKKITKYNYVLNMRDASKSKISNFSKKSYRFLYVLLHLIYHWTSFHTYHI